MAAQSIHAAVSFRQEAGIISAVGAGTFVFSFQVAAVLVALPAISAFLRPFFSAGWIVTTYLLCLTALLFLFGRLGDAYGNRRFYIGGLSLFTLASFLCATVHGPAFFLLARSAQGVGAALSSANSPALLTRHLLPTRRGRALGCQSAMTYLGLSIGPGVAAFLLSRFAWRSIFLVEVPAGVVAICLALYALPRDAESSFGRATISLRGAALWLACLVPLIFALSQGSQWGWFSADSVTLLLISALAVIALVLTESRTRHPLENFDLFRSLNFSRSIVCEALLYGGIYAIGFLIPILAVRSRDLGVATAGAILTTQSLVRMIFTPLAGIISDRFGAGRLISAGSAVFAFGALLLFLFCQHGSFMLLGLAVALIGLGTSLFVPANSARLFASAPVPKHGMAAGTLATARNLGMLLGSAGAAATCAKPLRLDTAGERLATDIRTAFCFVFVASLAMLMAESVPLLARVLAVRSTTHPSTLPHAQEIG